MGLLIKSGFSSLVAKWLLELAEAIFEDILVTLVCWQMTFDPDFMNHVGGTGTSAKRRKQELTFWNWAAVCYLFIMKGFFDKSLCQFFDTEQLRYRVNFQSALVEHHYSIWDSPDMWDGYVKQNCCYRLWVSYNWDDVAEKNIWEKYIVHAACKNAHYRDSAKYTTTQEKDSPSGLTMLP